MIQLHVHTDYSLLDSILQIPQYVKWVKDHGQKAAAITDHGTLGGLVDFWFECKAQGIKPILGCEFYHLRKLNEDKEPNKSAYHLVLLARNRVGFDNLVALSNQASGQFYKRPRITDADLKVYGKGLLGLGACLQGYAAQSVLHGKLDREWIGYVDKCLDGFWLEVMDNGIPEQEAVNKVFRGTGRTVATNDVHYATEEDRYAHDVALAIRTRKQINDPKRMRFNGTGYWLREDLDLPKSAIDRTHEVADMVEEYDIGYDEWQLPQVEADEDELWFALQDALFVKGLDKPEYRERLEFEYEVIKKNGFVPYFAVVSSLYQYFREAGRFVGWGRGSTGGSLVAFLLGITRIDPLRWGLLFERFLNPGRVTMPDIDMDFMPSDREVAIEKLRDHGSVYQIGTYNTLGTKEVINAVRKAIDVPTRLLDYVPNEAPIPTVRELMATSEFAKQVRIEENEQLVDLCLRLEGVKKTASIHAAGVVLTDDPLPVRETRSGANKGTLSTEWDMYALEKLKYVKFDILGVRNLEIIDNVVKAVGTTVDDIPLEDEKTMDLIRKCETVGIFQWESDGYKRVIEKLHPDTFDELMDLNTLYRPGCLESGITDEYIARKHGRKPVVQMHRNLNMGHQGLPLYQEDILRLAQDLAGFSLSEADILRKAIGKKEKETFDKIKEEFVHGCMGHSSMDREEALGFWSSVEKFSRYTWNRAHSVAYTLISWWTAYLSAHYPEEYLAELLNQAGSTGRRRVLLSECRRRGVRLKHPAINDSAEGFSVFEDEDGKAVLVGLSGIKFVGEKALSAILAARKDGPFDGPDDLKERAKVNSRVVESLRKAGAFGEAPTLEEEREILGCNIAKRMIELVPRYEKIHGLGEVIDIHKILTKRGQPMAFLQVEYLEDTGSVTVFPDMWGKVRHYIDVGSVAIFKVDRRDVLIKIASPDSYQEYKVEVMDAYGFLSFMPRLDGEPNIYSNGSGIANCELNAEMLEFIESEFGIAKIRV